MEENTYNIKQRGVLKSTTMGEGHKELHSHSEWEGSEAEGRVISMTLSKCHSEYYSQTGVAENGGAGRKILSVTSDKYSTGFHTHSGEP